VTQKNDHPVLPCFVIAKPTRGALVRAPRLIKLSKTSKLRYCYLKYCA